MFEAKFVGKLVFRSETPFHISGVREGNVLYMLRLSNGNLLIPASTWKGAFRAISEKIAPTLPMDYLERLSVERVTLSRDPKESIARDDLLSRFASALGGKPSPPFDPEDVKNILLALGYSEDELRSNRREDQMRALISYLSYYCPIGRIFGNQVRAASLRFIDTLISLRTQHRTGIGTERSTGTVKEGALYSIETSPAGSLIHLFVVGEIEKRGSSPARLLASTLDAVKKIGLNIGSRKSAGLGLLLLEKAEFHTAELRDDKSGLLLANPFKVPPKNIEEFTTWLSGH